MPYKSLVSELNEWWQGNQRLHGFQTLCATQQAQACWRKKPNTVTLLFLLQGWMFQTDVSQLNFWCGWMQQIAPPGRVQRVGFCMVAACNRYSHTWKSLFYKAFIHLWELRSLSVRKQWKTSRNTTEKLSNMLNWVSGFEAFKSNIWYPWLWKNLVDLILELDSMRVSLMLKWAARIQPPWSNSGHYSNSCFIRFGWDFVFSLTTLWTISSYRKQQM